MENNHEILTYIICGKQLGHQTAQKAQNGKWSGGPPHPVPLSHSSDERGEGETKAAHFVTAIFKDIPPF